jgi:DNA polymerase IV
MVAELQPLIDKVWRHCESTRTRDRTVTLNVKFADFDAITRSSSASSVVANRHDLADLTIGLRKDNTPLPKAVRLLGCRCLPCKAETMRSRPQLDFGI